MKELFNLKIVFLLLCFFQTSLVFATSHGTITGSIKDSSTGNPLSGANVFLVGTAMESFTNLDGEYEIFRVPPGTYTFRIILIGYKQKEMEIELLTGEIKKINAELDFDINKGETITITTQAKGQVTVINQQLSSNTITNVVSAERIIAFPDANPAESVGRLPGIFIKRSGGEANKIVIRGLSPTYNFITIDGERIPATDLYDRSVDLNIISPENLAAIEVTKALTPDKDADALGGAVDFKLADAPKGGFRYDIRFQEGYNNLRDELGQYKGRLRLSNRYWDEKLGIMVTGNMDRAQRGLDQFNTDYGIIREKREGEKSAPISIYNIDLNHVNEVRKRLGFSLLVDYLLPGGKLMVSNFMNRLERNEVIRSNCFNESQNKHYREFRERDRQIDIFTNLLAGEHNLSIGKLDWRLSRIASLNRNPYDSHIRFLELAAFDLSQLPAIFNADELINAAFNDLDETYLYQGHYYTEKSQERDLTARMNFEIPYTFTRKIAGYLKFGGKYNNKSRERDKEYANARLEFWTSAYERHHTRYGEPGFEYIRTPWMGAPSIHNYLDPGFNAGSFLQGDYDFGPGLNRNELNHLLKSYLLDSLYTFSYSADLDDYEIVEEVTAGYIMSEINFGRFFTFLPGVRYEHTHLDMTGRKGTVASEFFETGLDNPYVSDTTATASYGRWFPMFHTRIRPGNWFDIRLAYTRSISRPRFDWMLPLLKIMAINRSVELGCPDLKPQISTNYDLFLSFYSNKIGLFTIGGFYKKIEDLIFERRNRLILDAEEEGLPEYLKGFEFDRPENIPIKSEVRGVEVEWHINFRWMPDPFDGIILDMNYSHIWSETQFPRSFITQERIPVFPFFRMTVNDTFRVSDLPDQANDIAHVTFGYDKGPLSTRLSVLYQGISLLSFGERSELDVFTDDLICWNLSVNYNLTRHIGLFFNWNNFTNEPDELFQQETGYIKSREFYGWTIDSGISYTF
ncbi:MAG: TonB-dependent receptor [bacterium]|nr:MAG: TonB-dependent receptor [bacterium]